MASGNKLVIVESPTKAKKIGGYLGKGYTVMASVAISATWPSHRRSRPPRRRLTASLA